MYWDNCGPQWTDVTLKKAVERSQNDNYPLVVASNTGNAVLRALSLGADKLDVICVTHMVGFRNPGEDEMPRDTREQLAQQGVKVLTTTHVLAGVDRALRLQFGGLYPSELIAHTLRMFGQGTKVCVEIGVMALDAGFVPHGVPIVAVGGSGSGADTALVLTPAHSHQLFDMRIHEVLAKPRTW